MDFYDMKKIGLAFLILVIFSGIINIVTLNMDFNLFDNMKLNILVYLAVTGTIYWIGRTAYYKFV